MNMTKKVHFFGLNIYMDVFVRNYARANITEKNKKTLHLMIL